METLIKFEENEFPVRKDKDGNICLTDLWKGSGSNENQHPQKWQRQDQATGFIKATIVLLKVDFKSIFKTASGRNGGTFAHPLIALEYASYLNPALGVAVNQNFLDRIEEEKNPDLIAERYINIHKKKGKSDDWIKARFDGVSTRNEFTAKLKSHGVQHEGYRNATNAIYHPLYGGTSNVVRDKKGLSRGDNIRDNLPKVELVAIQLAEIMATEEIEAKHLYGNAQCELVASRAGKAVATAIMKHRN